MCPDYIDVSLRDLGEEKPQKKEEKQKEKKLTKLYGGGYFQEFQWMPDSYDAYYEAQQKDKEENKIKREAISAKEFIVAPPKTKGIIIHRQNLKVASLITLTHMHSSAAQIRMRHAKMIWQEPILLKAMLCLIPYLNHPQWINALKGSVELNFQISLSASKRGLELIGQN